MLVALLALVSRASAQVAVDVDDLDLLDDYEDDAGVVPGAVVPSSASDPKAAELAAEVYAKVAREAPSVSELVEAAYRTAGLDRDPSAGLARRVRASALIPWVSVRAGQDASWRDIADPTIGHVDVLDISATWHFDRLVLDSADFRVAQLATARHRERRRLASRVVKLYYRWLAARAVAERTDRPSPRADEAAAELDTLTDGWLGRARRKLARGSVGPQAGQ